MGRAEGGRGLLALGRTDEGAGMIHAAAATARGYQMEPLLCRCAEALRSSL